MCASNMDNADKKSEYTHCYTSVNIAIRGYFILVFGVYLM